MTSLAEKSDDHRGVAAAIDQAPAAPAGRIHVLDILRGMALLGMIFVHFHQKIELETGGLEDLIGWFTWIAVESKAWGTFAFLFGVGFAVLLRRLETKGVPVVAFYLRRLLGLAVFGLVAELCFGFQVLLEYALWGVPLLFIRRWPPWALLLTAVLSAASPQAIALASIAFEAPDTETSAATAGFATRRAEAREAVSAAELGEDYLVLLKSRATLMRVKYSHWSTYIPGSSFALFILGLLGLRQGVFDAPLQHVRLIKAAMAFGLASWALWWSIWFLEPEHLLLQVICAACTTLGLVRDQWLCLTYIGAMVLLTARWPQWLTRLSFLGTAGRMALTNYMLQIAALDFLASGYGVGLQARPIFNLVGTAALFGALVLLSRIWLARYRFGPAEWLWRSFTYGTWQPLRMLATQPGGDRTG
jgi:uncharacterized protein